MRRFVAFALTAALVSAPVSAEAPGRKTLTLERLTAMPPLGGAPGATGVAWRDGKRVTWVKSEGFGPGAKSALWQMDASTGTREKLLDAPSLDGKPVRLAGYQWNAAGTAVLLAGDADVFLYDFSPGKGLVRLTKDADDEEYPTFSPDGAKVAFVKKGDLHVLDVATQADTRLTADGGPNVLNGRLDWVYEEELANRRSGRSYEWAPDSSAIAFLRLDQARVPEYPIVDFLVPNGKHEPQRYPKAGDPNPIPTMHVVTLTGGGKTEYETSLRVSPDDFYVSPEISWTRDSKAAAFVKMNRAQTEIDVHLLRADGGGRSLLSVSDPAWINSIEPPTFLKDGSFVFKSETSGFLHLYRHGADGSVRNAITKGNWMVDGEVAVDEAGGSVLFVATEKDPRERHVYRTKLDGTALKRLTNEPGTHSLNAAPGGAYFVDTWSSLDTPPKSVLRKADGGAVATLEESRPEILDHALGTVEMGEIKAADGTVLYTRLVKPIGFDASKKYPVVVLVYGGPHAQLVVDRFGAASAFDQLLATKGYAVFTLDNRGSWGRGHAFETPLLKDMGKRELQDQLEGVAWLKKQPWVDPSRLGIWGWSYGGYMTLFTATHTDAFKVAVAGAPVTDWKFYDSIYTERYMKLPKENPEGYKSSSPLEAAKDLKAKLLVLHGTSDDNVHMQNSIAFGDALMKAKKDYTFVPLPRMKHGFRGPQYAGYVYTRILDWFESNLKPTESKPGAPAPKPAL